MNGGINFQDLIASLLQRSNVAGIGGDVERHGTEPSHTLDLFGHGLIVFPSANPDHAGLVLFDHELRPYFSDAASATDHHIDSTLSITRGDIGGEGDWRQYLFEPSAATAGQRIAQLVPG